MTRLGRDVDGSTPRSSRSSLEALKPSGSCGTTNATGTWPRMSSGAATTATSAKRPSPCSASCTWMMLTFSPPRLMMSSLRPAIHTAPLSSTWPKSPVLRPCAVSVFAVISGSSR